MPLSMFTITNHQLDHFRRQSMNEFVNFLAFKLHGEGIQFSDKELLVNLINQAKGAGIISKHLIYEFCKLMLINNLYTFHIKPDWLKNILYVNAESESKIEAIKAYIDEQIQFGNG